ncbi:MAG TPA: hypothetical protein VL918_11060, partial [Sphingobium sp.]|nr:hypothetical protein [Sphingobium sp.]
MARAKRVTKGPFRGLFHNPPLTVIPAKAGIQGHGKLRSQLWIPAFAGMTFYFAVASAGEGFSLYPQI